LSPDAFALLAVCAALLVGLASLLSWHFGQRSARKEMEESYVRKADCANRHRLDDAACAAKHKTDAEMIRAMSEAVDRLAQELAAGNEIFFVLLEQSPNVDKALMARLLTNRKGRSGK